jgi:gamma-glutamylputrescine oxidase
MEKLKYNLSYWEQKSFFNDLDVVIIGSGIVGLSAAIHLKKKDKNLRVLVVERGPLPIGASTRNAGFACFGSLTELISDIEARGESEVFSVLEKRWRGIVALRNLLGDKQLDFQSRGGFEMFTEDDDDVFYECNEKIGYFNEKLEAITGQKNVYQTANPRIKEFGFRGVQNLIWNQAEGQVDTGKMMLSFIELAEKMGIRIINGLEIDKIEDSSDGVRLLTEFGWELKTKKVLVAVNGFAQKLLDIPGILPARNQVLITKPIANLKIEGCFHYDRGYFYFRNIDGRILLGGGRQLSPETELTDQFGTTDFIKSALVRLLRGVIVPDQMIEVDSWWSGILGLGPEKKPIIEHVSPNVAISVRLSGMGVAIGTVVGQEGADLVLSDAANIKWK